MKPSKKESIKAVLILAGVLLTILVVIPVVTWLAIDWMVENTQKGLKEQLNNPIINESFDGWKKVEISDWMMFMIPGDWEIREDGDELYVTGKEGAELAFGAKFGDESVAFPDQKAVLEAKKGVKDLEMEEEVVKGFATISGSTLTEIVIDNEGKEEIYYCITLATQSVEIKTSICLLFPARQVEDFEKFVEAAQAIVFSFAFQTEK